MPDIKCRCARLQPNGPPKYDVVDLLRDERRLVLLTHVQAQPRAAQQGSPRAKHPYNLPTTTSESENRLCHEHVHHDVPDDDAPHHPKFIMLLRAI